MAAARKQPQDHRKPATEGDFEFEHNGETYKLPRFASIKQGTIRRLRKLGAADFNFSLLEEICKDGSGYEDALVAIDDMDTDEFEDMNKAWVKDAGVDPGES